MCVGALARCAVGGVDVDAGGKCRLGTFSSIFVCGLVLGVQRVPVPSFRFYWQM